MNECHPSSHPNPMMMMMQCLFSPSAPPPPPVIPSRLFLPFIFFLHFLVASSFAQPFAQGNLAVVFDAESGRNTDSNPQKAVLSSLWCQATSNGHDRLPIKSARFVHVQPPPTQPHILQARLSNTSDRAFLDFGEANVSAAGKYRCEITTMQDDLISGNLFVYMRPVLSVDGSVRMDQAEEGNAFAWIGPSNKVTKGEDALLQCPVVGYPLPRLHWFKDDSPINLSAIVESEDGRAQLKYLQTGNNQLRIRKVCAKDEGIYKCIARNHFPPKVDYPEQQYELSLEQHLRVSSSLSWLLPLLIIVVCLILLVLIIFGCSAWKKYKYKQYNVAQKERELGQADAEKQRLPPEPDELEE